MTARRQILAGLTGVGVGAIVLVVSFSLLKTLDLVSVVRQTQQQNTHTSKSSHSILTIIRDCTTPTGKCYQRNQAQNRSTIDSINEVSVYAATCAKHYGTVRQIESCVKAFIRDRPQPNLDRGATPTSSPSSKPKTTPTATASPPGASPKANRGSGPAKPKSSPAPSKPTKPTKPTKPPVTSPSPPVASPTPGLCLLNLICIR